MSSPWETSGTTSATPASRRARTAGESSSSRARSTGPGRRLEVGEQRVGLGDVDGDRAGRRRGRRAAAAASARPGGGRRRLGRTVAATEEAADRAGQFAHLAASCCRSGVRESLRRGPDRRGTTIRDGGSVAGHAHGRARRPVAARSLRRSARDGRVRRPDDLVADRLEVDLVAQPSANARPSARRRSGRGRSGGRRSAGPGAGPAGTGRRRQAWRRRPRPSGPA